MSLLLTYSAQFVFIVLYFFTVLRMDRVPPRNLPQNTAGGFRVVRTECIVLGASVKLLRVEESLILPSSPQT